ncbi:uncharacterized protein LOC127750024 isoform X2 [Frankliniella occidentalis]|uniref:Uncharacterized protein LOC127750024 isoform X2 n=1 Tax=Frankliniella occidentalis TaxID=133901 RepID=A0A9C6U525_FRAOC|nr:uncharacterized protein LOC127750024 isoform X2 [Frankliniella occidentalis]
MFGGGSTMMPFKHVTPILVIYTTALGLGSDPDGRADVETIVSALRGMGWMHTSIAVQKHDGSRLRTVPVYLSRPGFVPGSRCGFGPSTTTLALLWSAGQTLTADAVGFLKPHRPYPLNGCDVHVASLENPPFAYADPAGGFQGTDISLVDYFATDKNATVHFKPITAAMNSIGLLSTGFQEKDKGSFYDALKKYDVVVGGLLPTVERSKVFDFTAPYSQESQCVFLTARLPVDAWRYPFVVLSPQVWAATCGLMLLLVVVLQAMGTGGFDSLIILLGVLFDSEPNPKLISRRKQTVFLVFLWTIFCMHFNSGYRASLSMAFINHISKPGPSSFREVKRVGFLFGIASYLLQEDNQGTREIGPRLETCNSFRNCSAEIKSDPENMGLVMSEVSMWYSTPRYFVDDQLKSLLKRSESLATFFISFLIHKSSPLRRPLDDALTKTREFGINIKAFIDIERNLTRIMARNYRERLRTVDRNGFFLVFGVCGLLFAGLALAALVFCGELVHHRLSQSAPWSALVRRLLAGRVYLQ